MKVFPNPLSARDADGRPCGVVPIPRTAEFVGAKLCPKRTVVHRHDWEGEGRTSVTVNGRDQVSRPQTNHWVYNGISHDDPELMNKLLKTEPVDVPDSAYYIRALLSGELLAGDTETAKLFRVPMKSAQQEQPIEQPTAAAKVTK